MKHLIEFLVIHLVDKPEEVIVEEVADDDPQGKITFVVKADPEDLGRIIGHRGRTIKAIRSVASILAQEQGKRFEIDVVEA